MRVRFMQGERMHGGLQGLRGQLRARRLCSRLQRNELRTVHWERCRDDDLRRGGELQPRLQLRLQAVRRRLRVAERSDLRLRGYDL
jgi:hypothetical protein